MPTGNADPGPLRSGRLRPWFPQGKPHRNATRYIWKTLVQHHAIKMRRVSTRGRLHGPAGASAHCSSRFWIEKARAKRQISVCFKLLNRMDLG